jgi:probable rRNA maturation factor
MIDVEVFGARPSRRSRLDSAAAGADADAGASADAGAPRSAAESIPTPAEVRRLCTLAAASAGVHDGHLAVEFVDSERITHLNRRYRERPTPTDVLSFPVDGAQPSGAPEPPGMRELGDVVICPEHTVDVREAIVHGVLHLVGMDHETDDGEMLELQRALLSGESR